MSDETELVERLLAALSWIEMPFVTAETPADELRNRISFCLADAERAIEAFAVRAALSGEAQQKKGM